jgi:hypothetical protein
MQKAQDLKQPSWRNKHALCASLMGFLLGFVFVGARNTLPWNDQWLIGKGDLSADHLMWQFFRQTPLIQWPLSAMPNYVAGADTIFPTGNVIAPIFAKVIGLVVPGNFQYLGILIVAWFALQAYFAERLLSQFIADSTFRIIGSVFFVISPIFIYRISSMGHLHVAAHWLILAAMYLYFDKQLRVRAWAVLITLTVFINLYLAVIVVLIFIASLAREWVRETRSTFKVQFVKAIRTGIAPALSAVLAFVLSGFLAYTGSAGGAGFYRLNVFAFLNPGYSSNGSFSLLVNTIIPESRKNLFAEEWEGFQYLGLGVIIAIPFLTLLAWRERRNLIRSSWLPIALSACLLFAVALTNQVTLLQFEISYWWPNVLLQFRQIFRGASRFGFALYYLITLGSIVSLSKIFSKRNATIVLGLLLAVSLADQSAGLRQSHRDLAAEIPFVSALIDTQWIEIAENHSKLIIDKNFDLQIEGAVPLNARIFADNWYSLDRYAVEHHMSTNFGYVARQIQAFVKSEDARVAAELASGELDSKAIYLISNEKDWTRYKDLVGKNGRALILDGFFVIVGQ